MRRILTAAEIAEFRHRVCTAATEILAELGEDDFNMRQLAGRLGVSAMTAYRYFKDKNEILAAVRAQGFARLADRLAAVQGATGSMDRVLAALSRAYVEFAHEEQVRYTSMFALSRPRTAADEYRREKLRARAAFAAPIRRLADAGLSSGDPDVIAEILWSSLQGLMTRNLSAELSDTDCDRMICDTVHILVGSSSAGNDIQTPASGTAEDRSSFRTNGSTKHRAAPAFESAPIP